MDARRIPGAREDGVRWAHHPLPAQSADSTVHGSRAADGVGEIGGGHPLPGLRVETGPRNHHFPLLRTTAPRQAMSRSPTPRSRPARVRLRTDPMTPPAPNSSPTSSMSLAAWRSEKPPAAAVPLMVSARADARGEIRSMTEANTLTSRSGWRPISHDRLSAAAAITDTNSPFTASLPAAPLPVGPNTPVREAIASRRLWQRS